MARKTKPTRTGLRFIGMLKNAMEMDASEGPPALCHHLAVVPPWGGPPMTFMVFLAVEATGTVRVTCRELPGVAAFGEDETEALIQAEQAIRDALQVWPNPSGSWP